MWKRQAGRASWEPTSEKTWGPPDTGSSMWKGAEVQRAAIQSMELMGMWWEERMEGKAEAHTQELPQSARW